ncbi:MAG: hypothetical protein AB7H92_14720 [Microbacteriaceae bacterium]
MADRAHPSSSRVIETGDPTNPNEPAPAGAIDAPPAYMTRRLERWRRRTDAPLLVLAIGSLPLLLLELERGDFAPSDRLLLDVVNIVVLVAFAVDYSWSWPCRAVVRSTSAASGRAC